MTDFSVRLKRKTVSLQRRQKHIRKVVFGTTDRPRLAVFRSSRHIYAQLIDDSNQKTITGCSTLTEALKEKLSAVKGKVETAKIVGEHIAKIAKEKGIIAVCFDRRGKSYHGRVKALAEGARSAGLKM